MLKDLIFEILKENYLLVNENNNSVSYQQLLNSNIHPSIKNYIRADLKALFYRDKTNITKKSIFNYSTRKVDFLFNQIFEELIKSSYITPKELNNLLLQAISFNLSHLIKPDWSLKKIIFNDKKNVSLNAFLILLEYAFFYQYKINIIRKYFLNLNSNIIESDKFDLILNKINSILFRENKNEILLDFYKTAIDFIDVRNSNNLAVEIIQSFLTNNNLIDELDRLKIYTENSQKEFISRDEFKTFVLNDYITDKNLSESSIEDNITNISNENARTLENKLPEDEKISSINTYNNKQEKSEELFLLFDDDQNPENVDKIQDHEKLVDNLKPENKEIFIIKNEISQLNRSHSDFFKYLTKKEIENIQENIFNSDYDDFIIAIEKLISSSTFEKALENLNKIVNTYHIDSSSKEIYILQSALKKYYNGD